MEQEIVQVQQPAAPLPPVAVMPAANNNRRRILLNVCMWAIINAFVFDVVALIAEHTPCTKSQSTWVFRCLALTHTAAAELSALLAGAWCCVTVAELSALLHVVLTARCGCGGRWAVDALAWVALVATVGLHRMEVASGRIGIAAHPEDDTYFYVDVVLASVGLLLDLLVLGGLSSASPLVGASWPSRVPEESWSSPATPGRRRRSSEAGKEAQN